MQNIEEINLVTDKLAETPKYSLDNTVTSIEVYFNDDGQVLIVGVVDNNYIYWASLTCSDDLEMNRCIFDYISYGRIRKVTHLSKVLNAAGFKYEEVKRWVKLCLVRKPEDLMSWKTPFEGDFSSGQIKYNGIFFAKEIANYMMRIHGKCTLREAGGAYEAVLNHYLSVMNEDDGRPDYYFKVKELIRILESEEYLYGSQSPEVRRKYIKLREYGEKLYNRYMTAAR